MSNLHNVSNKYRGCLIHCLFDRYRRAKIRNEGECLVRIIDTVISFLDEDSRLIITNEFMYKSKSTWYLNYYSKSTFYRLKNEAMIHFLDCLHI